MTNRLIKTLIVTAAAALSLPTWAQLGSAVVVQNTQSVAPNANSWKNINVNCPAGFSVLSGGVDHNAISTISLGASAPTFGNIDLFFKNPGTYSDANGWVAAIRNTGTAAATVAVVAVCAPVVTSTVVTLDNAPVATPGAPLAIGSKVNCPAGYMATGGGLDVENPDTMTFTSSGPIYGGVYMSDLGVSSTLTAPSGWASYGRNQGKAGIVVKAAICTPTAAVVTKISPAYIVSPGAGAWSDRLTCDTNQIALGGAMDTDSVTTLVLSASAPTSGIVAPYTRGTGQYGAADGWQSGARNLGTTAASYKNGLICAANTLPTPVATTLVIEFYNSNLRHYFRTSSLTEAAAIDAGQAGLGWARTTDNFRAYVAGSGGPGYDVCRFYTFGANSHFYTANAQECNLLKAPGTGWVFEGNSFNIEVTFGSSCPAGRVPVYRAYNNRGGQLQDANHRFTTHQTAINDLVLNGWTYEGIAFCALP
jgi:Repeat of unknown function (DUF5648)